MRKGGRLSRKYVVALVALVTGALLASGAVQIYGSYNESKAALVALQYEKARGAASRIETFVKEIERSAGPPSPSSWARRRRSTSAGRTRFDCFARCWPSPS
jgi:hypothetical protein